MVAEGALASRLCTFLGQPSPLVGLELFRRSLLRHSRIASRLCVIQKHGLVEYFKPLHFLDRTLCRLGIIEHYESLAFGFEICFRDQVNDIAVFREDLGKGLLHFVNLDALLQIFDINSTRRQ